MRRCPCSIHTTAKMISIPSPTKNQNLAAPAWDRMVAPCDGSREITLVKIRIDIPLPIPRCVMSSPSHMIMAVPAVRVSTMSATLGGVKIRTTPPCTSWLEWKRNTSPVDWRSARITVMYRVAWVIFLMPISPCFCHVSSFGITTVRSCMMIELVMYGMIPSENTANCVSAPPENRSMNCTTPWFPRLLRSSARRFRSTSGTGMCEPSRKTAMMASVNRIFLRRSGILNALTNAFST